MSDKQGNLVALADAVAAALNEAATAAPADFAVSFTAERRFAEVADMATLKTSDPPLVLVFPTGDMEERLGGGTRPSFSGTYEIDLVIYARVGVGEAAESACEKLMLLRGQFRDFFKGIRLRVEGQKGTWAVLESVDGSPAYGMDSLTQRHCFVSAQTLSFAVPV